MKEPYQAFITASLVFLAIDEAAETARRLGGNAFAVLTYITLAGIAFGLVTRGIYLLFPFPLFGDIRQQFDEANPEAAMMERSDRVKLYRRWKASQD